MPKKRHASHPAPQPSAGRMRPKPGEPPAAEEQPTAPSTAESRSAGLVVPRRVARRAAPAIEPETMPAYEPEPAVEPEPEPEPARYAEPEPAVEPEPEPEPARYAEPEPAVEPEPEPEPALHPEPGPVPVWRPEPTEIGAVAEPEPVAPPSDLRVLHEPEPAWEPEPAEESASGAAEDVEEAAEASVEPRGGLLSRVWPRREAEPAPEPVAAPSFPAALTPEPITPELLASLEEPAEESPLPEAVADTEVEEPGPKVFGYRDRSSPVSTAPFAFVTPVPGVWGPAQAEVAGTLSAPEPEAESELEPEPEPTAAGRPVVYDHTGGVVEWADRVTEFEAKPSAETEEASAPSPDWLASRDEPTTVPLSAWVARPADAPVPTPVAPELPLPPAEEHAEGDWWPAEAEAEDAGALFVEDDWWSQTRLGEPPAHVQAPEDVWASESLLDEGPEPELLPDETSRRLPPEPAEDLIPIAGVPVSRVEPGWEPEGEPALELFEEFDRPAVPPVSVPVEAPPARPDQRPGRTKPAARKPGAKGEARRTAQRAEPRAGAAARPSDKDRPWWPVVLTIVAVLVALLVLIALGARIGTAALWNAVLPTEKAVVAPDEYSYVLPSWPVFGAAPAEAATAPPSAASVVGGSAGETVTVVLDPVVEAALPYPDPPPVQPVVIRRLKPQHRYVAITLDDGIPFDTRLMDLFARYDARATTFVLGQFASTRPELIDRLQESGFEVANHSWDHKDLSKMSEAEVRTELGKTQKAISAVTGNQAPYMRPPGGAYDAETVDVAASMGYRVVMWNRSLADTSPSATPEQLYHNAVDNLQAGDIILCHWGRPDTYAAMTMILPELQRRGFRAVTVSELIADSGGVSELQ